MRACTRLNNIMVAGTSRAATSTTCGMGAEGGRCQVESKQQQRPVVDNSCGPQAATLCIVHSQAPEPTSGLKVPGQKRPAMREPKMSLMAASLGGGTWKMANWRLRRLGMSLRPAPGVTMAATKLQGREWGGQAVSGCKQQL